MKRHLVVAAVAWSLAGAPVLAQDGSTATAAPDASVQALSAEVEIGSGIENLQPTGVAETYPAEVEFLVGWSRVKGAEEPTRITHVWTLNGEEVATVTLDVKSSNFRTYSRKTIAGQTGTWTLTVRDAAGRELGTDKVEVGQTATQ